MVGLGREDTRPCPNCGADNSRAERLRYSWRHWALKECASCRFVYLENPPNPDTLATDYSWEKNHGERSERIRVEYPVSFRISAAWRRLRRRIIKKPDKLARRIERWFPPGRVADLGCGDGGHLSRLPERFLPVGIEVSEELARRARLLCAQNVTILNMPAVEGLASLPDNSLSGIIMRSFLEHELRPEALLGEVARTLDWQGCAIVKVPNYACLNRQVIGSSWCGFHFPGHVNHFTPESLRGMIERNGLRVVSFGWLDHFFLSDNMWIVARREP